MASVIGTWSFSRDAAKLASRVLSDGGSTTDAVETALSAIEDDPAYGLYFVGRGSPPNSVGILQCDSAMMEGKTLSFGAVAALEGIGTPIRVARRVLESCPHSILVGKGAQDFAVSEGFHLESNEKLAGVQPEVTAERQGKGHDTIGLIVRDKKGNITVGVSTSGLAGKHPGRVGDSPLPGCGLYADNDVGAACATGDGDEILKFCPSYSVVRYIGAGLTPQAACEAVMADMVKRVGSDVMFQVGLIAMDAQGATGASGSVADWTDVRSGEHFAGFPYACYREEVQPVVTVHVAPPAGNTCNML